MGLLNARNLRRAKSLLEQNRHKVGDIVGKATDQLDKVSKGKTSTVSAKVEEAARKYSAGGVTHHDAPADVSNHPVDADRRAAPLDDAELQRRQAEANIAAANALRTAADAAAGVFGTMAPADRMPNDPPADEQPPTA